MVTRYSAFGIILFPLKRYNQFSHLNALDKRQPEIEDKKQGKRFLRPGMSILRSAGHIGVHCLLKLF